MRRQEAERRELLKHFVTPELRQLARGILNPTPVQTIHNNAPPSSSTTKTQTSSSRTLHYRQQRATRATKARQPRPNTMPPKTLQQSITTVQSNTDTKVSSKSTKKSHSSKTHTNTKTKIKTTPPTTTTPTTIDTIANSFILSKDEIHYFQRVQKEHEHLHDTGRWDGLWRVKRKRKIRKPGTIHNSTTNPSTKVHDTNPATRPCLANSRRYAYVLLLGRKPPNSQKSNTETTITPQTEKTKTKITMTSLAAGIRATQRQVSYGSLAAQRVMMDATRLHNAALDNQFLAQMLLQDQVIGKASSKYKRERRLKIKNQEQNQKNQKFEDTTTTTTATSIEFEPEIEIETEIFDDAFDDFGNGDLDMTAFGHQTNNQTNNQTNSNQINNDIQASSTNKNVGKHLLTKALNDPETKETERKEKVQTVMQALEFVSPSATSSPSSLSSLSSPSTISPPPSAPSTTTSTTTTTKRMATITLPFASSTATTTQSGMVFNSEKMCWETSNDNAKNDEDDLMAGFGSDSDEKEEENNFMDGFGTSDEDEEEDEQDGGLQSTGPLGRLPNQTSEDKEEDFMAGFGSDDDDWG